MSRPDLKQAVALVEQLGLAPMKRIGNTRPQVLSAAGYQRWIARKREVETEIETKLAAEGMRFFAATGGLRVSFAGVTGSSTAGLGQALNNWKAGAEKRLKAVPPSAVLRNRDAPRGAPQGERESAR